MLPIEEEVGERRLVLERRRLERLRPVALLARDGAALRELPHVHVGVTGAARRLERLVLHGLAGRGRRVALPAGDLLVRAFEGKARALVVIKRDVPEAAHVVAADAALRDVLELALVHVGVAALAGVERLAPVERGEAEELLAAAALQVDERRLRHLRLQRGVLLVTAVARHGLVRAFERVARLRVGLDAVLHRREALLRVTGGAVRRLFAGAELADVRVGVTGAAGLVFEVLELRRNAGERAVAGLALDVHVRALEREVGLLVKGAFAAHVPQHVPAIGDVAALTAQAELPLVHVLVTVEAAAVLDRREAHERL